MISLIRSFQLKIGTCLFCALVLLTGNDASAREEKESLHHNLKISVPVVIQGSEIPPEGFTTFEMTPPYQLSYEGQIPFSTDRSFILNANLGTLPSSLAPLIGIDAGVLFRTPDFDFIGQIGFQDQALLSKSPFSSSHFDLFYWGPKVSILHQFNSQTHASLSAETIFTQQTELANHESISTLIHHQLSIVLSPSLTYLIIPELELEGSLNLYRLGATGIASKEFAFGIDSTFVSRWNFGFTYLFKDFKVRAIDSIVTGVNDTQELGFQAPYFSKHYLLSKQVLTVEFVWSF